VVDLDPISPIDRRPKMKSLFLDLETTGISSKQCSIVQLGMTIEIAGDIKHNLCIYVKPFEDCVIEPGVEAIHNCIPKAISSGCTYKEVYVNLLDLMGRYVDKYNKKDKFFLIGYNIGFDDSFMREMWRRNRDVYYGSWFWWPPIDVAVLACNYLKGERHRLENFKLSTLAEYLNIKREGDAHDALSDIHLTREIYKRVTEVK
jgi:DNA polymerase-3 subunit epsilon